MYRVHLKDFTTWNPFTAFLAVMGTLLVMYIVIEWRDRRRHRRLMEWSDETARKSAGRPKK